MRKSLLVILVLLASTNAFSQQKKTPPPTPTVKNCHVPADTANTNTLALQDIKDWADSKSLVVRCTGGKTYTLTQFTISIIKQNPMQTLDFGIGNNGIPLMARKAIDQMGPMDTILMREVNAKDDTGKDCKLSTIVFKVAAESTTAPAEEKKQ
jgi:hypothetical protein